jgi:hypothetical protein
VEVVVLLVGLELVVELELIFFLLQIILDT